MAVREGEPFKPTLGINDVPFLHIVYKNLGVQVDVNVSQSYRGVRERFNRVAGTLIDVLGRRPQPSLPVLTVPDPAGLVDGVPVQLHQTALIRNTREDATVIHDARPSTQLEGRATLIEPDQGCEGAITTLGSLVAIQFHYGSEITSIDLAAPNGAREVFTDSQLNSSNIRPDVIAFVGMVGNYLEQL